MRAAKEEKPQIKPRIQKGADERTTTSRREVRGSVQLKKGGNRMSPPVGKKVG